MLHGRLSTCHKTDSEFRLLLDLSCGKRARFRGIEAILVEEIAVGFKTRTIEIQVRDELDFG